MKKILILAVFLLLMVPCAFAEEINDWVQVPGIEPVLGAEIAWYYSPSHTKINQQGRLETLIKTVCITSDNPEVQAPGDYMINVVYANSALEKRMTTSRKEYKKDGALVSTSSSSTWREITPGEPYDKVLQAAYKYASKNK